MLNDDQIRYAVTRFLGWRLPEDFYPDAGISFKRTFNEHTSHPMKHEPVGTNLLTGAQAEAMVRHMLSGMPESGEIENRRELIDVLWDVIGDAPIDFPARVRIAKIYAALGEDLGEDEDGNNIVEHTLELAETPKGKALLAAPSHATEGQA